jgi:hypothetical protein
MLPVLMVRRVKPAVSWMMPSHVQAGEIHPYVGCNPQQSNRTAPLQHTVQVGFYPIYNLIQPTDSAGDLFV